MPPAATHAPRLHFFEQCGFRATVRARLTTRSCRAARAAAGIAGEWWSAGHRGGRARGFEARMASCSSSALWSLSPASRSTWSSDVGPPSQGWRTFLRNHAPPPWTCSLFRPLASTCYMSSSSFDWSADIRILTRYSAYYNELRTHRSLDKDAPIHRAIQHVGRVISVPVLGWLHF
jgi:hypothetical protein